MENTMIKKSKSLKCGSIIKSLSIIALICMVLSYLIEVFYFGFYFSFFLWYILMLASSVLLVLYIFKFHSKLKATVLVPIIFGLLGLKAIFNYLIRWFYGFDIDFLWVILMLAPFVLLVLYIFKFHSKLKATIRVPIIFGLFALNVIFGFFIYYNYNFSSYYGFYSNLEILVCSILTVISALKGFNKKLFVVIPMAVCLSLSFIEMLVVILFGKGLIFILQSLLIDIGAISLYTALLLFGLKNEIPFVLSPSPDKEKAKVEKMNPEQALKYLKNKLDFDMITEEEYQAKRAEIISKL